MTYKKVRAEKMNDDWKIDPRIHFLKSFIKPLPTVCPECDGTLTTENRAETFCTNCGLVTSASIEYVGLTKIDLPYGRH